MITVDNTDNRPQDENRSGKPSPDQPTSRRNFLRWGWRVLGLVALGQGAYLGLRFLSSRQSAASTGEMVDAGLVSDFAPGTATPFDTARFFLIRREDGGFLALSSRCTHLACIVDWEKNRRQFACPCHGSVFNPDGGVVNPPAPRPLDRFPVSIADGGKIQVDTRQRIIRSAITATDLVYPSASLTASSAATGLEPGAASPAR